MGSPRARPTQSPAPQANPQLQRCVRWPEALLAWAAESPAEVKYVELQLHRLLLPASGAKAPLSAQLRPMAPIIRRHVHELVEFYGHHAVRSISYNDRADRRTPTTHSRHKYVSLVRQMATGAGADADADVTKQRVGSARRGPVSYSFADLPSPLLSVAAKQWQR